MDHIGASLVCWLTGWYNVTAHLGHLLHYISDRVGLMNWSVIWAKLCLHSQSTPLASRQLCTIGELIWFDGEFLKGDKGALVIDHLEFNIKQRLFHYWLPCPNSQANYTGSIDLCRVEILQNKKKNLVYFEMWEMWRRPPPSSSFVMLENQWIQYICPTNIYAPLIYMPHYIYALLIGWVLSTLQIFFTCIM